MAVLKLSNCVWWLCLAVCLLFFSGKVQAQQTDKASTKYLYQDIYVTEKASTWTFGNEFITLQFDKNTGALTRLTAANIPGNISAAGQPVHTVDFKIDTIWMVAKHGAQLLGHQLQIDKMREGVSFELMFGILPLPAQAKGYEYELTCRYTLAPKGTHLRQTARLLRRSTGQATDAAKMYGFDFTVPNVVLGEAADCVLDVPGPFFPKTFVAPQTPLNALQNKKIRFHHAPDAGLGIVAVSNPKIPATCAAWMETKGEVTYIPSISSKGKDLTLSFYNERSYLMPANFAVESDVLHLEVTSTLEEALQKHRLMCERQMPLDTITPDYIREMVLLEVYPQYFPEGFKGITKKLPFYKEVGFNTLYLMPHWLGGYSPIDFYTVDPAFGKPEDLQELIKQAHALGMKVFFDMVIHGFNEKSPIIKQRPDLFVKDQKGKLALHPTWKSVTTDWASPAYIQYMADLALHHVQTYDIDGYRLDAATYKGPGWDMAVPYPAYRSGSAAPELMERMLQAMHTLKPEAVMLSEVFGPVFYTVSNLVHDNQTEGPQFLLEKMEKGEYTAGQYKAHIQHVFAALPAGANRVYFARNHDTSWFYHFNGYTPRFMALEAIHALCVIPEVFAGDPKNKPNPDDDKAIYSHYKQLFSLRKDFPELARGELLLEEVESSNPMVFTAMRQLEGKQCLIIVSLSDKAEEVRIQIQADKPLKGAALIDGLTKQQLQKPLSGSTKNTLQLTLKPFQVVVGRVEYVQ